MGEIDCVCEKEPGCQLDYIFNYNHFGRLSRTIKARNRMEQSVGEHQRKHS